MPQEKPGPVTRLACTAAAGLFGLLALFCGLAGLWIWLVPEVGAAAAPLVVGGVFLLLSLIFLLFSRRRRIVTVPATSLRQQQQEMEAIFKEHKGALLLALFTAAFQSGTHRR